MTGGKGEMNDNRLDKQTYRKGIWENFPQETKPFFVLVTARW
jgi:hypothetical protein